MESKQSANTSSSCTQVCGEENNCRSCARIVLVKLTHHTCPGKEILTHAVLDDQSTDVFITDSLVGRLGVQAAEIDLQINTVVGFSTIRTQKVTGLHIQDVNHEHGSIRILNAYTREYIPTTQREIETPTISRQWKHLANIAESLPNRPDIDIGMLVGRNVPAAFQPISVISGGLEEPWGEQYKFGWTIIGRVCKDDNAEQNTAYVNHVTVERETLLEQETYNPCVLSSSAKRALIASPFASPVSTKDMTTPEQLREMMELDCSELKHSRKIRGTEQTESVEDQRFLTIPETGLQRIKMAIGRPPFKSDDVTLPNNKRHCLKRLLSLKRKLLSDQRVQSDYLAFMQKIPDRGHASRVTIDQLTTPP